MIKNSIQTFGICNLDTSHPAAWAPYLKERVERVLVYDDSTIHPPEYREAFCREHGFELCENWTDFVDRCEAVAIMGVDWDRHVEQARPFVERDRTVFIDKPIACRDRDLDEIESWKGKKLVLGSSTRLHERLQAWRKETGVRSILSTVGQDEPFAYASHAVEMGQTVAGTGAEGVRWLADGRPSSFQVRHRSGVFWVVQIQNPHAVFHVLAGGEERTESIHVKQPGEPYSLHGEMVSEVLGVTRGEEPKTPVEEAVEAICILRAAHTSRERGGEWVALSDAKLLEFSGEAYAAEYRERKYPGGVT